MICRSKRSTIARLRLASAVPGRTIWNTRMLEQMVEELVGAAPREQPQAPLPAQGKNYMSPAGFARLSVGRLRDEPFGFPQVRRAVAGRHVRIPVSEQAGRRPQHVHAVAFAGKAAQRRRKQPRVHGPGKHFRPAAVPPRLDQGLVLTSGDAPPGPRTDGLRRVMDAARVARTWGDCYGYALVATGRAEAMLDPVLSAWDAAAVRPIIEEAGGVFTDFDGARSHLSGHAVATNAAIAEEVRALLRQDA